MPQDSPDTTNILVNTPYQLATSLIQQLNDEECDSLIKELEYLKKKRHNTNRALQLAVKGDWDSLKELICSEDGNSINPNEKLSMDDSPLHDCTLAWLLEFRKKSELLLEIIMKNEGRLSLDFNAQPHNQSIMAGCTLAWLFTYHKNQKLFRSILATCESAIVNLNARPSHLQNPFNGYTVAWNLIYQNEIQLFIKLLMQNTLTRINLNERHEGITLTWLLAVRGHLNLLDYLIEYHCDDIVDLDDKPMYLAHAPTLKEILQILKADALLAKLEQRISSFNESNHTAVSELESAASPSLSASSGPHCSIDPLMENESLDLIDKTAPLPQLLYNIIIEVGLPLDDAHYQFIDERSVNTYTILHFILKNQWHLLEQFIRNENKTNVDLNTQVRAINSQFFGCTLAGLLVYFNQMELFKILLSECSQTIIDLNAPSACPNQTSLAWMLAERGEIATLEYLVEHHHPDIVDLDAKPTNEQPTLKQLLQKVNALALLTKLEQRMAPLHEVNPLAVQESGLTSPQVDVWSPLLNDDPMDTAPTAHPQNPSDKRIFFSRKYHHTVEYRLQEVHYHQEVNQEPPSFSCKHQLISLADTLDMSETKALTLQERLHNSDFLYISSLDYYAPTTKNLAEEAVTFIFAGRKKNAYIPNMQFLGNEQQCILVLTREEFNDLNINKCPDSLGFLVIDQLGTESHDVYTNTGSIQARRLAAFFVSFHWELKECIYLDDNIEWVGINLPLPSHQLNWSEVTHYLRQQREDNHALIAGLPTVANRTFDTDYIALYYCSKLFSMDFQQISTLLKLQNDDDVFILGYPAVYDNQCGEDYFFQVLIDFANFSDEQSSMNLIARPLEQQAAIKRSAHQQNLAQSYIKDYANIEQINIEAFKLSVLNKTHQHWITLTLTQLKEQAQKSREHLEMRQHFEKTRNDLPQVLQYNAETKKRKAENKCDSELQPKRKKKSTSKKKDKLTKKQSTQDWTPFFSGIHLNQLMEGTTLSLETYLTSISHLSFAYQQDALNVIAQTQKHQGVLEIATGSGKTRLQILLINYLVANQVSDRPIHIVTATQQLVEQFYQAFQETLELLENQAHLTMDEVISVKSGSGYVPWRNYHANNTLKQQAKIVIFCEHSYQLLQKELYQTTDSVDSEPSLILLDEFHLYAKMAKKLLRSQATVLGFSATLPKRYTPIYQFSRLDSLQAKITAPMIIDRLPYRLSNANEKREDKISRLIRCHSHPRDGRLLDKTKGIIFVSSIAEADQLADAINQSHPERLAISIHSGLSNYAQLIAQFQKKKLNQPGILIVVGMLQTGYDDKNLSWCIIARNNNENSTTVRQIIGRVLRGNPEDPQKIAYILTDQHLNLRDFGPLKDKEAIVMANKNYFKVNREIIYLDILHAIQKNEEFASYQPLFENNRLADHSLKKHLELVLRATNQDWLNGLFQYDQYLIKNDLLACFAYAAYGSLYDPQNTDNKELYTAMKFEAFLEVLIQFKPQELQSWISKTEKKSCHYWMEKISEQCYMPHYLNILARYKQKLKNVPPQNKTVSQHDEAHSTTYNIGSSSHSLFANPGNTNPGRINPSYEYNDEDIYTILRLRLQNSQVPGLIVLSPAHMSDNHTGNRVIDVLKQYLTGPFAPQPHPNVMQNIIIPINYHHHWVGIRIQLIQGQPPKLTYYNSIKGYDPDADLMDALLNEVNQALSNLNLWASATSIHPFERSLEQHDATSCGALLIENIYCDLEQKNWPQTPNLTQTLRSRHLKLLSEGDPNFYRRFCESQFQNEASFQQVNFGD
ncbi:DEAD/DEAH box helicase [Legionella fallonii]|uniref:Uncharacterized protein n=1 Tax=Legionella fallonii LLAP-10 TaxID=1212491 RepID=A0A098G7C4_9GAMM|nr:DEAD/DEAH box helicase family protein [Legionella fallonii]CEG58363.1 conserved protein of unknown function [Legionella fallonii LLAP-10]